MLQGEVLMGVACVTFKGGIGGTYTMGQNEEILDGMGQSIWIWSVVNGGHHFSKEMVKSSQIQRVLFKGCGFKSSCQYIRCRCN